MPPGSAVFVSKIRRRAEMLRSAAAADVQTITAALVAAINSLPGGVERVQLYRAVQDVQSAARACVDKYTLWNPEGDPVAYKG